MLCFIFGIDQTPRMILSSLNGLFWAIHYNKLKQKEAK